MRKEIFFKFNIDAKMGKKNNLWQLIKRDLHYGYEQNKNKYIIIALSFLIIALLQMKKIGSTNEVNFEYIFFQFLKGVPYITFASVEIPFQWIIINGGIIYLIGNYMKDDFQHNGIYIITRTSKKSYWNSKIICCFINVLLYYIMLFFVIYLSIIIAKDNNIIRINGEANFSEILNIFILYFTTSILLTSFYMILLLVMKENYSYCILMLILIISIFGSSDYWPGQQSLILRHVPYDTNSSLTFFKSLIYNFIGIVIVYLQGIMTIKHKDLY